MPRRNVDVMTPKQVREEFGARLTAAIAKSDVTQAYLAKRLKVTPGTISHWKKGQRVPTMHHLVQLAILLDETVAFLVPDRLASRDSLERMSRQLGTRLGSRLLVACSHMDDDLLIRHIEAAVGEQYRLHGPIPDQPPVPEAPKRRARRK